MNNKTKVLIIVLVCVITAESMALFITYRNINDHVEKEKEWMTLQLRSSNINKAINTTSSVSIRAYSQKIKMTNWYLRMEPAPH